MGPRIFCILSCSFSLLALALSCFLKMIVAYKNNEFESMSGRNRIQNLTKC